MKSGVAHGRSIVAAAKGDKRAYKEVVCMVSVGRDCRRAGSGASKQSDDGSRYARPTGVADWRRAKANRPENRNPPTCCVFGSSRAAETLAAVQAFVARAVAHGDVAAVRTRGRVLLEVRDGVAERFHRAGGAGLCDGRCRCRVPSCQSRRCLRPVAVHAPDGSLFFFPLRANRAWRVPAARDWRRPPRGSRE